MREWSSEGENERNECFQPILFEIERLFAGYQPAEVNVLVPGAGLGRLPFEIARRGYSCQGNEYSLFMLFASNFILNKCTTLNAYTVYPWVHQSVNNLTYCAPLRGVRFPDISPQSLSSGAEFSMVAGNFIDIYSELDRWHCICTCFFLDTGRNPLVYVEKIWQILRPGGFWINVGPLLYHYANGADGQSIEPSWDLLRDAIKSFGFQFLREQANLSTHYTQNPQSMLTYRYKSMFFVCQKPDRARPNGHPADDCY